MNMDFLLKAEQFIRIEGCFPLIEFLQHVSLEVGERSCSFSNGIINFSTVLCCPCQTVSRCGAS